MISRAEATRLVVELAGNAPIVGSIGNPNGDLAAHDRPQNYYVWAMGMASSVGLGLAIARPERPVIVLDGDGAILMNLGSLASARMAGVKNLVHIIWDNSAWEITGGQPTGSAYGVDLAGIARASGFANAVGVETIEAFREAVARAIKDTEPWVIVAATQPGNARSSAPLVSTQLRDRFRAAVTGDAMT